MLGFCGCHGDRRQLNNDWFYVCVRYHDRRTLLPPGVVFLFFIFLFFQRHLNSTLTPTEILAVYPSGRKKKGTGRSYYGHKKYICAQSSTTVVWASKASYLASFFWNYIYPIVSFLAWGVSILPRSLPGQHISLVVEMTIGNTGCSSPDGINNWLLNTVVGGVWRCDWKNVSPGRSRSIITDCKVYIWWINLSLTIARNNHS